MARPGWAPGLRWATREPALGGAGLVPVLRPGPACSDGASGCGSGQVGRVQAAAALQRLGYGLSFLPARGLAALEPSVWHQVPGQQMLNCHACQRVRSWRRPVSTLKTQCKTSEVEQLRNSSQQEAGWPPPELLPKGKGRRRVDGEVAGWARARTWHQDAGRSAQRKLSRRVSQASPREVLVPLSPWACCPASSHNQPDPPGPRTRGRAERPGGTAMSSAGSWDKLPGLRLLIPSHSEAQDRPLGLAALA